MCLVCRAPKVTWMSQPRAQSTQEQPSTAMPGANCLLAFSINRAPKWTHTHTCAEWFEFCRIPSEDSQFCVGLAQDLHKIMACLPRAAYCAELTQNLLDNFTTKFCINAELFWEMCNNPHNMQNSCRTYAELMNLRTYAQLAQDFCGTTRNFPNGQFRAGRAELQPSFLKLQATWATSPHVFLIMPWHCQGGQVHVR